jgi:peptidoglycan/LPS O-acetylase OafA/YrhL
MPYNPALDGLRAVAVMLVVLFHARAPIAFGGYLGVDIFFVLSGYLITSLLLSELDTKGTLDLRRFYLRRLLRLTPALFAMLAVYLIVAPFLWPATTDHGKQAAIAATYLSDYAVAFWGTPDFLSHTWSLSVEEHFYLLWPLVLLAACRRWDRRSLVWVFGAAYGLATLVRWVCIVKGQSWEQVYYRFDTHLSGLMLGAWLAALRRDDALFAKLQPVLPWLMWFPVAASSVFNTVGATCGCPCGAWRWSNGPRWRCCSPFKCRAARPARCCRSHRWCGSEKFPTAFISGTTRSSGICARRFIGAKC